MRGPIDRPLKVSIKRTADRVSTSAFAGEALLQNEYRCSTGPESAPCKVPLGRPALQISTLLQKMKNVLFRERARNKEDSVGRCGEIRSAIVPGSDIDPSICRAERCRR